MDNGVRIVIAVQIQGEEDSTINRRSRSLGSVRTVKDWRFAPHVFIASEIHRFWLSQFTIKSQVRITAEKGSCVKSPKDHKVNIGYGVLRVYGSVVLPGATGRNGDAVGTEAVLSDDTAAYSMRIGVPAQENGYRQ